MVDGQVILIKMSDLDSYNARLVSKGKARKTPVEYLKEYWDIPPDYWVEQISDCMLRGMTELDSPIDLESGYPIKRP